MQLSEWYETHRQEIEEGKATIAAHFIDDWRGQPRKTDCRMFLNWPQVFADCDIVESWEGEAEIMSANLAGGTSQSRKVKAYRARIDCDQANLAIGRKPPKPRKKKIDLGERRRGK